MIQEKAKSRARGWVLESGLPGSNSDAVPSAPVTIHLLSPRLTSSSPFGDYYSYLTAST